ncbi:hypothetical protein K458DRAFT_433892 [Lentithecium fluviatile CBS 122367]|uniref:Uncharacterized protein n=1 Tax=Lentithecium fluviatile CBS 122367 TaxID=1168545 RepID=A0A6G1IST1_9PLEO|nr:hypothetical protein K458DRAFT_433892 [Lentithecium fluviatile CBS 122367]
MSSVVRFDKAGLQSQENSSVRKITEVITPRCPPSSTPTDIRDNVSYYEAETADQETARLVHQSKAAEDANDWPTVINLAWHMMELRLRVYKPHSSPVGGTYAVLGSAYKGAGRLEDAAEEIEKALTIYDQAGNREDASLTREQLAQLRESQGRFGDAREV